jgi:uncharacterized repeat protein (TIGR01451 family)
MRYLLLTLLLGPLADRAAALSVFVDFQLDASCGFPTGLLDVHASGGIPPYTYQWSNGATTEDIQGLAPGYYEVTVTDAASTQVVQGWTIFNTPNLVGGFGAQDSHASCIGQIGGEMRLIEWGTNGLAPYTYDPPPDGVDQAGYPFFYFPFASIGDPVSVNVTDANGCAGTIAGNIVGPQMIGGPNMVLQNVQASCSNGSGGSGTITNLNDGSFWGYAGITLFDALNNEVDGTIPGNTCTFNGLAPGHYHVERYWSDPMVFAYPCDNSDSLGFDIPDLGVACGTVSGDVFIDNDQDCAQGGGEVNVPELVLEVQPGGAYTITDASGHYSLDLVDGSYTLAQNDASLVQICPATAPVPFTLASNAQIIDLADSSTVPLDLKAFMSAGAAHPGFSMSYAIKAKNLSPQVTGLVTMTLDVSVPVTFLGASVTPTSVVGNSLTWDLPALSAYAQHMITVQFDVPVGTALGTAIYANMNVTNTLPDANVANNGAALGSIVTGSFDPNEKVAEPAEIFFLDLDDHFSYVIRFQNTGTDTAFTVVVTDTLSADLNMGSFLQGASSHPCTVDFLADRVVRWTFANILLPDSNTNEAASHGFLGFEIKPAEDLIGGTYINNASDIFFDFNEPIRTNTTSVLAEFSVGVKERELGPLSLFPNPASDQLVVSTANGIIERMRVVAIDGRVVKNFVPRTDRVLVDVRDLWNGAYCVEVELAQGGGLLRQRFVKQ